MLDFIEEGVTGTSRAVNIL